MQQQYQAIHEPIRDYIRVFVWKLILFYIFFQFFFFISCFFSLLLVCLSLIVAHTHSLWSFIVLRPFTNFTVLLNAERHWNFFYSRRHLAFFLFVTFCYNFCVWLNPLCVDRHLAWSLLKCIEFIDDINRYMVPVSVVRV